MSGGKDTRTGDTGPHVFSSVIILCTWGSSDWNLRPATIVHRMLITGTPNWVFILTSGISILDVDTRIRTSKYLLKVFIFHS